MYIKKEKRQIGIKNVVKQQYEDVVSTAKDHSKLLHNNIKRRISVNDQVISLYKSGAPGEC